MADALRAVSLNTAHMAGDGGKYMDRRFWDILHPPPEDNRTGDEIAADVLAKTGIRLIPARKGGGDGEPV